MVILKGGRIKTYGLPLNNAKRFQYTGKLRKAEKMDKLGIQYRWKGIAEGWKNMLGALITRG